MKRRGYNHRTPVERIDLSSLNNEQKNKKINQKKSLEDLIGRCKECRARYYEMGLV